MSKKRKHEENGKTSTPIDGMHLEGHSDTFPSSTSDLLIQLKDIIQVKVNTDELLQNLEKKVGKLQEKVKRKRADKVQMKELINEIKEGLKTELIKEIKEDLKTELINEIKEDLKTELIEKFKEDLKLELQDEMQKLEEKVENKSKEHFSVFKEDFEKQLKKEPDLEIEQGINKDGSRIGNHCSAAPFLRSQPCQSQTTRFKLAFKCTIHTIIYKGKPIRTSDSDYIEVVMYDCGKQIAPDHDLASAAVELVVVDGEFGEGYWSKEEFVQKIMKSRQVINPKVEPPNVLVKNGSFRLTGGRYRLKGVVITENSNRKDVKLGVMIVGNTEERVVEGVSNSFRVQEAKTEKAGQSQHPKIGPINPHNTQNPSGTTHRTTGNGSVGSLPLDLLQYHTQQDITQVGSYATVQGPQPTFPLTEHNFGIVANQSQKTHAHTAGNGPSGQPLVDHLQQQNTTQHGATQQKDHGQSQQYMHPKTRPTNSHNTLNPSSTTYHGIAGNGSLGPIPVNLLQYRSQQDITQMRSYVQGSQPTFLLTEHNFGIAPNQSQKIHAHTAGNGPRGQPLVHHLLQKSSPQQDATKQEVHAGQAQQHMHPKTGPLNSHNMLNPSGTTYHRTSVQSPQPIFLPTRPNGVALNQSQNTHAHTSGNGPGGHLLVDHVQQQNTIQQGATQQEDHAGKGQLYMHPKTVPTYSHNTLNPSGTTYHRTAGNGSVGTPRLDLLQSPTQHYITQTESYVQGPQQTFLPAETVLNQSQEIHAQTPGNGLGGQPLVERLQQQNTTQQGAIQLEYHAGQGQQYMYPNTGPTSSHNTQNPSGTTYHRTSGNVSAGTLPSNMDISQMGSYVQGPQPAFLPAEHNFEIMLNQSQEIHAQTAGNGPGGQPLVDSLQQQSTTQQGATQQEYLAGQGAQFIRPNTGPTNSHKTQNPSGTTPGNASAGTVLLDLDISQMGGYVQGLQPNFLQAEHNFGIMPNQSQRTHAHTAGNGRGGHPLIEHVQQQNNIQEGATQQEDHGSDVLLNLDLNNRDEGPSADMICTGPFATNVFDSPLYSFGPGSGSSADHAATPDDLEQLRRRLHHSLAGDLGEHSAGVGQLLGPQPQTEDAYQDGGAIDLLAPRIAASAPEGTQMNTMP